MPSRITTKVLKTARLFLQDRDQDQDQDQMFKTKTKTSWSKTKTKTKTFIFVLEAPRNQDPGLEDYINDNITIPASEVRGFNPITTADNFLFYKDSRL